MNNPDISVAILTYNHEKHIAQAINSVLEQKTSHTYEIIISDDCSKDNTVNIIKEYQNKYPDLIKLIVNKENLGITENFYNSRCNCNGKYIATLSGDDYWIDENKIEKQASFLDQNNEYYAVVTLVEGRFNNKTTPYKVYPKKKYRSITINKKSYLNGDEVFTHGMMIRNEYINQEGRDYFSLIKKASRNIDDIIELLLIVNKGMIYSMNINGAAHRVYTNKHIQSNYCSSNNAVDKFKDCVDAYNYYYNNDSLHDDLFVLYRNIVSSGIAGAIRFNEISRFKKIYNTIPNEYRDRNLLLKSIPQLISISFETIIRKIKARFN